MKIAAWAALLTMLLGPAWAFAGADAARPIIDNTHDRVQTTLTPGLKRIGTIRPRGAREVGRSNLAIGCEMLDRDYGDFEQFKAYIEPLGIKRTFTRGGRATRGRVQRRVGRQPVRHAGQLLWGRRRARPTEGNRGRFVAQGRSAGFPAVPPAPAARAQGHARHRSPLTRTRSECG